MKAAMYTPPSVRKKAKASKPDSAIAIHAQDDDGNNHIVGLGNLRVAIVQDGKFWFAQGLDLDYGAQGNTADEAKTNFENGLHATLQIHLKVFGTIKNILKVAPSEVQNELLYHPVSRFSQVSGHHIESKALPAVEGLPFSGIEYMMPVAA